MTVKEEDLAKVLAYCIILSYDFKDIGKIILKIEESDKSNFVDFTLWLMKNLNILSKHYVEKIRFIFKHGEKSQIDYLQDFLVIHLMKYWSKESKKVVEVLETHGCSYHCLLTTELKG